MKPCFTKLFFLSFVALTANCIGRFRSPLEKQDIDTEIIQVEAKLNSSAQSLSPNLMQIIQERLSQNRENFLTQGTYQTNYDTVRLQLDAKLTDMDSMMMLIYGCPETFEVVRQAISSNVDLSNKLNNIVNHGDSAELAENRTELSRLGENLEVWLEHVKEVEAKSSEFQDLANELQQRHEEATKEAEHIFGLHLKFLDTNDETEEFWLAETEYSEAAANRVGEKAFDFTRSLTRKHKDDLIVKIDNVLQEALGLLFEAEFWTSELFGKAVGADYAEIPRKLSEELKLLPALYENQIKENLFDEIHDQYESLLELTHRQQYNLDLNYQQKELITTINNKIKEFSKRGEEVKQSVLELELSQMGSNKKNSRQLMLKQEEEVRRFINQHKTEKSKESSLLLEEGIKYLNDRNKAIEAVLQTIGIVEMLKSEKTEIAEKMKLAETFDNIVNTTRQIILDSFNQDAARLGRAFVMAEDFYALIDKQSSLQSDLVTLSNVSNRRRKLNETEFDWRNPYAWVEAENFKSTH